MYSSAGTAAYPTLRLPLVRYASLLNGPNQDAEDPTTLLRSHMSSENTSPNSTVPLFRRREPVTKAEPDAELEVLARQFHNLKASIQHELAREPSEPPATTFVPDEEEAEEPVPTKPFGSPAEYYEPALPPPPPPEEPAMEGGTLSEEIAPEEAAAAPSEMGSGSGFSDQHADESLASVFSAMRDSLRGTIVPSSMERMRMEADAVSAGVEGDDHLEGTTTDLMRHAAALSASGFFRVNAVPGESVPADAAPPSVPPTAPPTALPAAPSAAPCSTLSATSRPFAPPPTREEQRWLERQLSDMDSAAVRSQLEASEEHAGSGGAPLSGDEQARRERRRWGCYVAMI